MYNKKELKYILKYLAKLPYYEAKKLYYWFKEQLSWFNKKKSIAYMCAWISIIFWLKGEVWLTRIFAILFIIFYIKSEIAKGLWKHLLRENERKSYIGLEEVKNGRKKKV